jgi:hypothetical protein
MPAPRRYTKKAQVLTSVRLPERDRDLLYTAARQRGISQSEAIRQAVRSFATTVLFGAETQANGCLETARAALIDLEGGLWCPSCLRGRAMTQIETPRRVDQT